MGGSQFCDWIVGILLLLSAYCLALLFATPLPNHFTEDDSTHPRLDVE
jgi:hypothetical protein